MPRENRRGLLRCSPSGLREMPSWVALCINEGPPACDADHVRAWSLRVVPVEVCEGADSFLDQPVNRPDVALWFDLDVPREEVTEVMLIGEERPRHLGEGGADVQLGELFAFCSECRS